jgi:hypothetical protein
LTTIGFAAPFAFAAVSAACCISAAHLGATPAADMLTASLDMRTENGAAWRRACAAYHAARGGRFFGAQRKRRYTSLVAPAQIYAQRTRVAAANNAQRAL